MKTPQKLVSNFWGAVQWRRLFLPGESRLPDHRVFVADQTCHVLLVQVLYSRQEDPQDLGVPEEGFLLGELNGFQRRALDDWCRPVDHQRGLDLVVALVLDGHVRAAYAGECRKLLRIQPVDATT
ncbi:hypothetical protein [Cupriavidus sp. H39]|uniref:hypothetical protein n=1 Tax=Cupriavidus sp. H39 TaxID=3401635 RepID=UPI003D0867E8